MESTEFLAKMGSQFLFSRKYFGAISLLRMALHLNHVLPDAYFDLAHCYQMICSWHNYKNRMRHLTNILAIQLKHRCLPSVAAHTSMLYPLSLDTRRRIATSYAKRCRVYLAYGNLLHKCKIYASKFPKEIHPVRFFQSKIKASENKKHGPKRLSRHRSKLTVERTVLSFDTHSLLNVNIQGSKKLI